MKGAARLRLAAVMFATLLGLTIPTLAEEATFCKEKNNKGMCLVPFTFVNNYRGQPAVYLFIKGIVKEGGKDVTYYVSDAKGGVTITPPLKAGTYVSLPEGGLRPDAENKVKLPQMEALRFYVSLGNPLQTCCNNETQGGPVAEPNGWSVPSNLAPKGALDNFNTIFDFLELTWVSADGSFGANTTQVDMFGLPMQLEVKGTDRVTHQAVTRYAGFTQDFETLMKGYMKLGAPWTNLVLEPVKGKVRQIIAPHYGLKLPQNPFPEAAMKQYIADVFIDYRAGRSGGKTLQSTVCEKAWTGNTFPGTGFPFRFRVNNAGDWLFEILRPDVETTYRNQLNLNIRYMVAPPVPDYVKCAAEQVARDLGAQLIRTTLRKDIHLYQGDCPAPFVAQFYKQEPIQQYAKFWHDNGIKNLAYSFGYDDTCNQSGVVIVDKPTALKVTVGGVK